MGFKDWETPPGFFKALNEEFHFTLDAAASHENALCDRYCSKEGLNYKGLDIGWETTPYEGGGLGYPWTRERVFCNPPYDSSLSQWVDKAIKREAEVAVLLLPPSVDTAWFHCLLKNLNPFQGIIWRSYCGKEWRGWGNHDLTLLFNSGRLKFWKEGKVGPAPRAGNLLAIFRR